MAPQSPPAASASRIRHPVNPELHALLASAGLEKRFVSGAGARLHNEDGLDVLDFVAGYGALPLGHNPRAILDAVARHLAEAAPCMIQPQFPDNALAVADRILDLLPEGFTRVVFGSTGAEANEAALKAARMATGRHEIIAMERSFHGKTRGAMAVTDMRGRGVWSGSPDGVHFVPFGELEAVEAVLEANPSTIAAVIAEPLQAEGGVFCALPAYFQGLRALCTKHGVMMILDEVQTGFARTGPMFAMDELGVVPDILTLGKALGGGVMPIAATVLSEPADSLQFALQHSSTFAGNKHAASAALAFLDAITSDDHAISANVAARSEQLAEIHEGLLRQFPKSVVAHRGRGLLRGLELVADPEICAGRAGSVLAMLAQQGRLTLLLAGRLMAEGLRVAPTLGRGSTLRVEPPLTVTESECAEYGRKLAHVLAMLEARDTAALCTHLVGAIHPGGGNSAVDVPREAREIISPRPDEGRFAFVMHPLTEQELVSFDPALDGLSGEQLEVLSQTFAATLEPFRVSRVRITGADGSTAVGDFIVTPQTTRQLLRMSPAEAAAAVQKAIDLGVEAGARIVGLGGYTSIVTQGGRSVDGRGCALTTGNGFTMEAAMMAAEHAATILNRPFDHVKAAIVGAAGAIGCGLIGLAGTRAQSLLLFVNPGTPFEKSLKRLVRHLANVLANALAGDLVVQPGSAIARILEGVPADSPHAMLESLCADVLHGRIDAPVSVSISIASELPAADLVLVATSQAEAFIQPEMLKPGAIVCDMSRPGNISFACRDERDDVLVIDGGIIAFPGYPDLGVRINMPRGVAFACMAETAILALAKRYVDTSTGVLANFSEITMLRALGRQFGFKLADLRAFDRAIGRIEWSKLKQLGRDPQQDAPDAARSQIPTTACPPSPESIGPETPVDYYGVMIGQRAKGPLKHRAAVMDAHGNSLTWTQLDAASGAISVALGEVGIGVGSRVYVSGENTLELVKALAALWRLGAVPVLIDPQHSAGMLSELGADVGIDAAIVTQAHLAQFAPVCPTYGIDALAERGATRSEIAPPSRIRPAQHPAVIVFTSGSTGRPKAVRHSVADLVNTCVNYGKMVAGISQNDCILSVSRLFFTFGFNTLQMSLWLGATALIAPQRFDALGTLARIETQRPTVIFGVPTVYLLMLRKAERRYDLSSLRLSVSAGEPLAAAVRTGWGGMTGAPMIDGLGTSEVISTFISNSPDADDQCDGSIGTVVPGVEIQLRRADGSPVETGEAGIAWVRSNTLCDGYLNTPQDEQTHFVDGWYNSNDVLRCDADGRFFYLGRANDMVKVGGIWLSSTEIEDVLHGCPEVLECAVVLREEEPPLVRPYAFVVARPGVPPGAACAEDLIARLRSVLAPGRHPHGIVFLESLPRTHSQKIQRFRLAQQLDQLPQIRADLPDAEEARTGVVFLSRPAARPKPSKILEHVQS